MPDILYVELITSIKDDFYDDNKAIAFSWCEISQNARL
tara:strand:+ start:1520 stop:1633 length:114 start_codon:yes stop_codon:yes gene_type:complete